LEKKGPKGLKTTKNCREKSPRNGRIHTKLMKVTQALLRGLLGTIWERNGISQPERNYNLGGNYPPIKKASIKRCKWDPRNGPRKNGWKWAPVFKGGERITHKGLKTFLRNGEP